MQHRMSVLWMRRTRESCSKSNHADWISATSDCEGLGSRDQQDRGTVPAGKRRRFSRQLREAGAPAANDVDSWPRRRFLSPASIAPARQNPPRLFENSSYATGRSFDQSSHPPKNRNRTVPIPGGPRIRSNHAASIDFERCSCSVSLV